MSDEAQEDPQEPRVQADEGWKQAVAEEKARLRQQGPQAAPAGEGEPGPPPEADIRIFLAGLYTQTLVCLGEIAHPASGKAEKSLPEAQYLIDTIAMLKDKTKGNLTDEEGAYVDNILYDLRMRFVSASARGGAPDVEEAQEEQ
jgi:hypothetical protein